MEAALPWIQCIKAFSQTLFVERFLGLNASSHSPSTSPHPAYFLLTCLPFHLSSFCPFTFIPPWSQGASHSDINAWILLETSESRKWNDTQRAMGKIQKKEPRESFWGLCWLQFFLLTDPTGPSRWWSVWERTERTRTAKCSRWPISEWPSETPAYKCEYCRAG